MPNSYDEDAPEVTSKTFETEGEAMAFLLGFRAARSEEICVGLDPQDSRTLTVELLDEEAAAVWAESLAEHQAGHPDYRLRPST